MASPFDVVPIVVPASEPRSLTIVNVTVCGSPLPLVTTFIQRAKPSLPGM